MLTRLPTLARTLYAEALRVLGDAAPAAPTPAPNATEPVGEPRKPTKRIAA